MEKEERLICSAIHFDNGIFIENPHQPRNIKSGLVICGLRHHNCLNTFSIMSQIMLYGNYEASSNRFTETREHINTKFGEYVKVEGFLSNYNKFYNREESLVIARACGQVKGDLIASVLISEDLW